MSRYFKNMHVGYTASLLGFLTLAGILLYNCRNKPVAGTGPDVPINPEMRSLIDNHMATRIDELYRKVQNTPVTAEERQWLDSMDGDAYIAELFAEFGDRVNQVSPWVNFKNPSETDYRFLKEATAAAVNGMSTARIINSSR